MSAVTIAIRSRTSTDECKNKKLGTSSYLICNLKVMLTLLYFCTVATRGSKAAKILEITKNEVNISVQTQIIDVFMDHVK